MIIVISLLSYRTIIRNNDWKTRASLWRSTVEVSPLSAKAHNNMGDIYGREGNLEMSAKSFKRATEINPKYSDAYHNLAMVLYRMNRLDEAQDYYKKYLNI